jgi:hypothetical protein
VAAIGILNGLIAVAIGIVARLAVGLVGIGARLLGGSFGLLAHLFPAVLIVLGIIWLVKGASRVACGP